MCLVDLENAFDCVPWGVLQEGMGYLGCCYNPFNQIIQLLQELDLHSQQKVGHVPPEGGLRADTGKAEKIISLGWPGKASVPCKLVSWSFFSSNMDQYYNLVVLL